MSHSLQHHRFYRTDSFWWTAYVIQCIMIFFWPPNTFLPLDSDVSHSIPFSNIRFNISMVVADKITVLVWATAPRSGYMFRHSASTAPNSFILMTEAAGSFKMSKHGPTMWCSNSKWNNHMNLNVCPFFRVTEHETHSYITGKIIVQYILNFGKEKQFKEK